MDLELDIQFAFDGATKKTENRAFRSIHKRVVCRYWLTNTCTKGDSCEFLHEFNSEKMPECRKGQACADPSCVLNHPNKTDTPLCPNYEAGFCSFGHSCSLRHEFRHGPPPAVADLWLVNNSHQETLKIKMSKNVNWRKAPCPYFKHDGWCPYFSMCAFKH